MLWLKQQSKALVGVDIGTRYVKLVELEHREDKIKLLHYAIASLPITVLSESNEIKNTATISATLAELKEQSEVSCQKAAIAMPGSAVVTKQVLINKVLNDSAIEAEVWLEASKHFPELVEDLSLDFEITGQSGQDQLEVLLVACRKTFMQKLVDVLEDSHFQAEIVDVDYYALERILKYLLSEEPELDPSQTYAILNFGTHSSTLVVLRNQRLLYAHDQVFDGQRLLQRLQQEFQWSDILLNTAEIKRDIDISSIVGIADMITNHVNYSLELLYSSVHEISIQKLFLSGDCAIIPHLAELITERSSIDTVIANPFKNIAVSRSVDMAKLQSLAPALTLCCGLAFHEGKQ